MSQLFILFEHAAGYALFRVREFEEIAMFLPQVEQSVSSFSSFQTVVHLIGFTPFKSAITALENTNYLAEGIIHEDLQLFLETNLPKSIDNKKSKNSLGVSDPKIGTSIIEQFGIKCVYTGVVPEIIRGIRQHFPNFIKGFTDKSAGTAQLGLGHSYSRSKVKFNVNRVDNMIIQGISLLDQLDKDINTFSMRIREWYSYHFPELVKIVSDNYIYPQVVKFIKNRKDLDESHLEQLEEIVSDANKARAILDASRSSMGMDISPIDLINIECFASRVSSLNSFRSRLQGYLRSKMAACAPNLATLIGDQVGARLISRAGSLTSLAKYPASTVQILGAEKALFRALKLRTHTPKHGLIYHSPFIGRATGQNKGRISRYLANKCSIASRIDCFSDIQTTIFGQKLRDQVEERLHFYDTGSVPRKNVDVMKEAMAEANSQQADGITKSAKKGKGEKNNKSPMKKETPIKKGEKNKSPMKKETPIKKGEKNKSPMKKETPIKKGEKNKSPMKKETPIKKDEANSTKVGTKSAKKNKLKRKLSGGGGGGPEEETPRKALKFNKSPTMPSTGKKNKKQFGKKLDGSFRNGT